uniref:tetratricopeptide repeat protein n=1 Tax=Ningiella ruwaisensis TaxID=2364274 RepID=UPI0010A070B9|nr:tetratricopeptide repeat protein [Ningiella ruwaisensis]
MKLLKNTFQRKSVALCSLVMLSSVAANSFAQSNPAIACPGYKQPKTQILSERTGKKLQSAIEAYNEEKLSEAISIIREIDPKEEFDKAAVDRLYGQMLLMQDPKNAPQALTLLEGAVKAKVLNDRDQADLLQLVGDLSLQEEKYREAISYYNQWMEFTCKEEEKMYTRMAQAYSELQQYDKVIEAADKAIALQEKPDKNPYALKVNAYHETKNYPEGLKTLETLVQLFPTEKQWWTQLGFYYMLTEDYPKALSTFSLAYKQGFVQRPAEFKALVQLYASQEVPFKSAELQKKFMEAGEIDNDADSIATLANSYHQAKEFKEAAQYYAQAAQKSNDPEMYRKQGALLLTAEDYKGAITALERALAANISDPGKVHFSLMEANFYAGNYRDAFEHAEEAAKDAQLRRNANAWIPYIKEKAKNRGIRL